MNAVGAAMAAMSVSSAFRLLVLGLAGLAVLSVLLAVILRMLRRHVRRSMMQHSDSLVGRRAMVVSDLRPRGVGAVRAMLDAEDEHGRKSRRTDEPSETFPAVSDQFISKGRVVRVTGGDRSMYRVRPIT